MAAGQIDEIDLVTPETAGVNQKKEMQPNGGYSDQNGRNPVGLTQGNLLEWCGHGFDPCLIVADEGVGGWPDFAAADFAYVCCEPRQRCLKNGN
jgi:hypothetical protein